MSETIASVEEVKKANIILYSVSKRELLNNDYTRIFNSLNILSESGKFARGKLMLTFNGFDDDKREIYEIKEIREYVRNIYKKYKYMFYFLTNLDNNRSVIFACLNDYFSEYNNKKTKVQLAIVCNEELRNEIIESTLDYGLLLDDVEETQRILFTFI